MREPNYSNYYPEAYTIELCELRREGNLIQTSYQYCYKKEVTDNSNIKYYILYGDTDLKVKKKLKRPIIITDGFDPGNKRDFYKNNIDKKPDTPKDNDGRGLYHLIDGQPSPWYSGNAKSPGLISSLRNAGYDIIIVDFLDGAGDIFINANAFKNFISNVINGSDFRDENTEDLIIIGPSMGGLITRLAISEMEKDKIDHKIKLWFSFDSPQEGAYIPIALQHSLNFLKNINHSEISKLKKAVKDFKESLSKLNTDAAKQMLILHYDDRPSYKDDIITPFYKEISNKEFPMLTTNYAITNGTSKNKLYDNPTQIIDFKIFSWTYVTGQGLNNSVKSRRIFKGSRQGFNNDKKIHSSNQVPFENTQGGWHSGLYSLNCNPGNVNQKSDTNIPYTKSTFIPTASAFGVKITRDNVSENWKRYATCDEVSSAKISTPFDKLRGMESEKPEEHVTISKETAKYLLEELNDNMVEYTYPPVRRDKKSQLSVKGIRLFRAVKSLTFAGDGNKVTIEAGSKVRAEASNSITFKPGFTAKAGSEFTASIKNVTYNSQLKSSAAPTYKPVDYSKLSPYLEQVVDYSDDERSSIYPNFEVEVFPNPVKDFINLKFKGGDMNKFYSIKLFNLSGNLLYEGSSIGSDEYTIVAVNIPSGVFLLKVTNNNHKVLTKIVKQ